MVPFQADQYSEDDDNDCDGSKSPAELEHRRTQIPFVFSWNTCHVVCTKSSILNKDLKVEVENFGSNGEA